MGSSADGLDARRRDPRLLSAYPSGSYPSLSSQMARLTGVRPSECEYFGAVRASTHHPRIHEGLVDIFDDLLTSSYEDLLHFFGYSRPDTVDGADPLCGEAICWRHPKFGNYADGELASSFANAHTHHYTRALHNGFTCLIWLLTDAANWLPDSHRTRLINGMRTNPYSWTNSMDSLGRADTFRGALWLKSAKTFRFSREVRSALGELVEQSLTELGVLENVGTISDRFIEGGFVAGYYAEQVRLREIRIARQKR